MPIPTAARAQALLLALVLPALAPGPAFAQETAIPSQEPVSSAARERASQYYEDALVRFNEHDYRGAAIRLKNALSADPNHLPARILMGRVHVQVGDGAAAEKELRLARLHGADENLVLVPLARAYLLQEKYQEILQDIRPGVRGSAVEGQVLELRGEAYLALGLLEEAEAAFRGAAALMPLAVEPLVGEARVALAGGDSERARALLERALEQAPATPEAWYVKGEVARHEHDLERAVQAYGRAIELRPGHLPARLARAAALMDLGEDARAEEDVAFVQTLFPDDPQAAYLEALLRGRAGDREGAQAALRRAAARLSELDAERLRNDAQSLLLLGSVAFAQERYEEAERHLRRVLELTPPHPGARKMLGTILLERGQAEAALDVLEPALLRAPEDPALLSLLGRAFAGAGRRDQAVEVLEQAVALNPRSAALRAELGRARLAAGEVAAAIEDLRAAFALEGGAEPGLLLGQVLLEQGRYPDALEVAETLAERHPRDARVYNLAGVARLGLDDRDRARASLEKALVLDARYEPARLNLGKLDALEGRIERARERYQTMLRNNPEHVPAMAELATLAEHEGDLEEAIRWLEKVRTLAPGALGEALRLVDLYIETDSADVAHSLARELEGRHPEDLRVLAALGRAEIARGDPDHAQVTFQRMSRLAGYDADGLAFTARHQLMVGDVDGARWSLLKAAEARPDALGLQVELARLELRMGRVEDALERAKALEARAPDRAIGLRLRGDALMQKGELAAAAEAYRAAYEKAPGAPLAVRLAEALERAGEIEAAFEVLEERLAAHPEELPVRLALASGYLRHGRIAAAIREHERLLEARPEDARVLNNLASLYHRSGDPRALELARKAYRLAPEEAAVLDTLGWILVSRGDPEGALPLLRQAHARAASRPEVRYHLGVTLSRLGRLEEAKGELEAALALADDFDGAADARALLAQLSGG